MGASPRRQTALIVFFLLLGAFFVSTFRMGVVRGASMEPTYHDGQVVLVRRRSRLTGALQRGDIVLIRKDRDVIIKRVYRLPGEEIDATADALRYYSVMNDLTDYYEQTPDPARPRRPKLTVPANMLVVLGDNKSVSEDSRFFGPVPLRDVLGAVVAAPGLPPAAPAAAR